MGDFLIGSYKRTCEAWPSAELPQGHFTASRSDAPALILSGGRDPVTPVSGGNRVAEGWPNSLHVSVPNGGHGVGGDCISQMIQTLVESASISGLDQGCVEDSPPTVFEILPRDRTRAP